MSGIQDLITSLVETVLALAKGFNKVCWAARLPAGLPTPPCCSWCGACYSACRQEHADRAWVSQRHLSTASLSLPGPPVLAAVGWLHINGNLDNRACLCALHADAGGPGGNAPSGCHPRLVTVPRLLPRCTPAGTLPRMVKPDALPAAYCCSQPQGGGALRSTADVLIAAAHPVPQAPMNCRGAVAAMAELSFPYFQVIMNACQVPY